MIKFITTKFTNYHNKNSGGSKLRAKRFQPFLDMIKDVFRENGSVKIIDIGGTQQYWNIIPKEIFDLYKIKITIINLPSSNLPKDSGPFKFAEGNACCLDNYKDNSFDLVHSNSVIEHVGDWDSMINMANECSRIAPRHFIQTPNYWFPVEPHCLTPFFHWYPKPLRIWLVMKYSLGNWSRALSLKDAVFKVESARLLNKKMIQALFPKSEIKIEKFFFLNKSFIALKNKI